MNFTALQQELSDRGWSRLSATRMGYFINEARQQLDNMYQWPYRLTTASGASPLTVTDLGTVEEVLDTANRSLPLDFRTRRTILDQMGELTSTGSPYWFYIDNGVIRTYPVGGTLSVRYYKRSVPLSAGADIPLAPVDFHLLLVDMAEREAHAGKTDYAGAEALETRIQRKIALMVDDQFGQQSQGPDAVQVLTDASCDG